MEKTNGVAAVEDFLLPEFEDVTLPSGMKARLWPPNDLEFYARCGVLPGTLAAAARGEAGQPGESDSDRLLNLSWKMICAVFISPKFSLTPKAGELHPRRLCAKDRKWIDRWAAKYLDIEGLEALESFRRQQSGAAPAPGSSGGDVPLPAEQPAKGDAKSMGD